MVGIARKACTVLMLDPKSHRYKSRRPEQASLEKRIKEIAETRVRYGYRRVHVLLRREGWAMNVQAGYAALSRDGPAIAEQNAEAAGEGEAARMIARMPREPNDVWAMDFVHDQLATGKKLRILTVVDTFSRFSPVDRSALQPIAARMSSNARARSASASVIRRRSASIRAPSSSRAISICGRIRTTSRSTSRGPESRPTTRSSNRSTGNSGRNA